MLGKKILYAGQYWGQLIKLERGQQIKLKCVINVKFTAVDDWCDYVKNIHILGDTY